MVSLVETITNPAPGAHLSVRGQLISTALIQPFGK
jgi:hypothetical protein